MKINIKSFIAAALIVTVGVTTALGSGGIKSSSFNSNKVILDGKQLDLGEQRMISVVKDGEQDASNYMPVRGVLEAMGYTVEWDGQKQAVVVSSKIVELTREQITPLIFPDPISTNLLPGDDNVNHVIRIKIGVGINNIDKKMADEFLITLKNNEVLIRDIVIDILHNKTNIELIKPNGSAALKEEILEELQAAFNNNLIVEVNISDMYIN